MWTLLPIKGIVGFEWLCNNGMEFEGEKQHLLSCGNPILAASTDLNIDPSRQSASYKI